ncbi:ABC transporter ATP-binding protein [Anaerosalibacter massiliensis]|uniref:ABC transporter ATP-binding protein n=1 Tax=Anaerosalibacter massiliensis TaxID=1347392 RepID=A0A9X2MJ35_9FIRM|nr:ABC transporter ATP-binding protein [Anaerosalibacter massiliensis]MCR2044649.1 ABC transporter ATP-binding protein [Anaerosalibacter massiliensis]
MGNLVEIKRISKNYFNKKALDNLSLNIEEGKVLGILGPNGSGKTTLIKIMTGLLRQSSGELLIDGHKVGVYTKSIVSYLPDRNFLYNWMIIKDALNFYSDFYYDFDEKRAEELLHFMQLEKNMKITSLSKGMMEKLNLILVLSRKAKLYILDEPIAGVDPVARDQILDAIIKNYDSNSSMIVTTHLVRDMESLFDDVAFLKDGKIILEGNAESLREEKNKSIDEIYKEVFSN